MNLILAFVIIISAFDERTTRRINPILLQRTEILPEVTDVLKSLFELVDVYSWDGFVIQLCSNQEKRLLTNQLLENVHNNLAFL